MITQTTVVKLSGKCNLWLSYPKVRPPASLAASFYRGRVVRISMLIDVRLLAQQAVVYPAYLGNNSQYAKEKIQLVFKSERGVILILE